MCELSFQEEHHLRFRKYVGGTIMQTHCQPQPSIDLIIAPEPREPRSLVESQDSRELIHENPAVRLFIIQRGNLTRSSAKWYLLITYGCHIDLGHIPPYREVDRRSSFTAQSRTLDVETLYRLLQRQALLD